MLLYEQMDNGLVKRAARTAVPATCILGIRDSMLLL